ncbi:MAG: protein-L-isoaspartate(D-aspartate) O-methyltransferase [Candidatus Kerfeldbacteria bacterium]|nr:protein-L-isoaspartate(D-aspartate) O-methyltransferase [Candidatus Kerfeldbacteria bacterium]
MLSIAQDYKKIKLMEKWQQLMYCTKVTNELMIEQLLTSGVLRTPRIQSALRNVDRRQFVPSNHTDQAYDDIPLPIGYGQTISQPWTVVFMLELLQPRERDHCLDVGCGSGWAAALLSVLVGPRGHVTTVERIPQLVSLAQQHLQSYRNVSIARGDASRGWPPDAPYDIIHVAAATSVVAVEMKDQLAVGGRLIIPLGEYEQELALITKISDNRYTERRYSGFQFVPLISKDTIS